MYIYDKINKKTFTTKYIIYKNQKKNKENERKKNFI